MTANKHGSAGEEARREARKIVWETCDERINGGLRVEDVEWTGYGRQKEWRLKPGAEEAAFISVYPDEWFAHLEATTTSPQGNGNLLSVLAASALAGAAPRTRNRERLRTELHEAKGDALGRSGWSQIIPGLRKDEWLELIHEEGLSWRRSAEILRTLKLESGRLTLPVNDHGKRPKT